MADVDVKPTVGTLRVVDSLFHPEGETMQIFIRGRRQGLPGFDAEPSAVSGTDDFVTLTLATGQFHTVVRANIFYRETLAAQVKDRNVGTVHIDNHVFTVGKCTLLYYVNPFSHYVL